MVQSKRGDGKRASPRCGRLYRFAGGNQAFAGNLRTSNQMAVQSVALGPCANSGAHIARRSRSGEGEEGVAIVASDCSIALTKSLPGAGLKNRPCICSVHVQGLLPGLLPAVMDNQRSSQTVMFKMRWGERLWMQAISTHRISTPSRRSRTCSTEMLASICFKALLRFCRLCVTSSRKLLCLDGAERSRGGEAVTSLPVAIVPAIPGRIR